MRAIETCRSAALGGHVEQCNGCGQLRIAYNSCRYGDFGLHATIRPPTVRSSNEQRLVLDGTGRGQPRILLMQPGQLHQPSLASAERTPLGSA
jgi:hypothetical protein